MNSIFTNLFFALSLMFLCVNNEAFCQDLIVKSEYPSVEKTDSIYLLEDYEQTDKAENWFDGSWQVKVNPRQKQAFDILEGDITKEVNAISDNKRRASENVTLKVRGFEVTLMSIEQKQAGMKWSKISYH